MKHLFLLFFLTLFGPSLFAQCSGFQIVADKSSVCAPEIIRYQLLNPVAGSTYEWNVGNGTVYGADTLFAFYTNAMTINATVKITLPSGAVCNITENNIAVVNPVPVPVFDASKFILCDGPASIELTDITPNSDTRSWVVDGTNYNSTGNTITHQFVTTGDKKVSLIVIDSNGCKGVGEFLDTIKVYPKLNFDFAGNSTRGCVPKAMSYSLTSDPSTPFTKTFTWSFPGANNTSHVGTTPGGRTYDSSGNYDATLQVDVSNGCTYTINKGSYMRLGDTVNLDLIASNTSFCSNETILLKQLDSPIIGTTTWTYLNVPVTELGGNNYEKQIRCNDEGNLTVELSHNYNACITTKTFNNIIEIKGVKADFVSTDYYHCEVPHTVHLTNLSDSMDATSVTYKWRILDAGSEYYTSTNEHDSFTFNTMPASYTVQLIAFGNNGCTDTLTREDYIYQDSLKLEFDANPSIACVGQQIQFLNNTKRSSYLSPDNFKWYFYALDNSTVLDSSEVESPTFSYSDTGYYSIMLTGQNGIGCRDTLLKVAEVHVISTESSFEIPDTIICTGETMTLLGKSEPANAGFTHNWTLKKINSSYSYSYTGDSVLAVPTVLGDYWAVYQSSISGGCFSKDSTKIYVNGIVTDIELDTMSGCAPLTVNPKPNIISDFHEGIASPAY